MTEAQKVPRRDELPAAYTWDLSVVYADIDAWDADVAKIEGLLPDLTALQGKLGEGAGQLLRALHLRDEIARILYQLYTYASNRKNSDSTDPAGQALDERAGSLLARIGAALAFIEPEILGIAQETIASWLKSEPKLQIYGYELEELARQRAHIRSAEVESILAQFGDVTRAPSEIFEILTNADLKFPEIDGEAGQKIQLSHARYGRLLESQDRRVRRDAFKNYYSGYQGILNTLGTTLAAEVRSHVVNARVRGYESALAAALEPRDIPLDVYRNLVKTINANLPKLHRYMELRKRMMGLDELRIYDTYAPLVPQADVSVPYDEARDTVQAAFRPLGADYADALAKAFNNRWIDVYENVGKRSGAYSSGSYSTPPFILLNYQDRLRDMFTLAHELGHSMHSYFTRRTQPFVYGSYTIFVAEVASTLNEALLNDYLLKNRDDAMLRKSLIVQQLDDIRATIFRQTMFAEFELDIHTRAEAGEPLTSDSLSKSYYELVKRYQGPPVTLDDEIAFEWARIPHFYYNFYVYQYATGLSAALALSRQIIDEGQPAVDRYLRFLSSGSSRSSIDMLRDAGVDMTTPAPIQAAMDAFDRLVNELEALA
ncbi:MAG TPA: oligoendopeptidase F [Kouleothrix sp.]|uniref:oligoendopeptidase F n=1 Tax=Kouleothrix sp. TaxID=2779161 RepID=UPI002B831F4A|nr:oligoendopeptidase F [Kouleothrix sp.]HRC76670.1 oligoendopeptidase F [Kouleothrix sp.]